MMLREIGLDEDEWNRVVDNVMTSNEGVSDRFNPTLVRSQFTSLTTMIGYLDDVNNLVDLFGEVVRADSEHFRVPAERIREIEEDFRRLFGLPVAV